MLKSALEAAVIMTLLDRLGLIGVENWLEVRCCIMAAAPAAAVPAVVMHELPRPAPRLRVVSWLISIRTAVYGGVFRL